MTAARASERRLGRHSSVLSPGESLPVIYRENILPSTMYNNQFTIFISIDPYIPTKSPVHTIDPSGECSQAVLDFLSTTNVGRMERVV